MIHDMYASTKISYLLGKYHSTEKSQSEMATMVGVLPVPSTSPFASTPRTRARSLLSIRASASSSKELVLQDFTDRRALKVSSLSLFLIFFLLLKNSFVPF
jgi:hypothetical protein